MVDDNEFVRRELAELIAAEPELSIAGQASTAAEALLRIPDVGPDVAIVDILLPDGDGIELCRTLLAPSAELRCLIFSSRTDETSIVNAILAGASGYVVKDIRDLEIVAAVKAVGAGKSYLDHSSTAALISKLRREAQHDDPGIST